MRGKLAEGSRDSCGRNTLGAAPAAHNEMITVGSNMAQNRITFRPTPEIAAQWADLLMRARIIGQLRVQINDDEPVALSTDESEDHEIAFTYRTHVGPFTVTQVRVLLSNGAVIGKNFHFPLHLSAGQSLRMAFLKPETANPPTYDYLETDTDRIALDAPPL